MAAYMRKTGILPVCTNNEARAYFAGKGLAYADVTEGNTNPILRAFIEWCDALAATKEKEDTQQ